MVSLRENKKLFAGLLISAFTLVGCGGVTFDTPLDADVTDLNVGKNFPYTGKVETFRQGELLENEITLSFQAFSSDGLPLTNLNKNDFRVYENNQLVQKFNVNSSSASVQKADIVFVIDKTGSMGDEINGVKENVRNFVDQLKSVNILANLCLVTFDDLVQDECLSFHADDPSTTANENLDNFLDSLERVQAKGGGDDNENQLAGLISAAEKSPWRPDAQRITILITDEGFSHTGNPGRAAEHARGYNETYNILEQQRITNYIVGPKIPGYSSSFQGTPALALTNNFFDITELVESSSLIIGGETSTDINNNKNKNKKNLGDILATIASSLTTEYTINYNVHDNNLTSDLPANERIIRLEVITVDGAIVQLKPVTATFPDGQPVVRNSWALSQKIKDMGSVAVYLNNQLVDPSEYTVHDQNITFQTPPKPGVYIRIYYASERISGGIQLSQIKLSIPNNDNTNLIVYFNGIVADGLDYTISKSSNGRYHLLSVVPEALDDNDKYEVELNKGLHVTFEIKKQNINVE